MKFVSMMLLLHKINRDPNGRQSVSVSVTNLVPSFRALTRTPSVLTTKASTGQTVRFRLALATVADGTLAMLLVCLSILIQALIMLTLCLSSVMAIVLHHHKLFQKDSRLHS